MAELPHQSAHELGEPEDSHPADTQLHHHTPVDSPDPLGLESELAGADARQALHAVTAKLARRPEIASSRVSAGRDRDGDGDTLLLRTAPGTLHVVGDRALAAQMRTLLGAGEVAGWRLHPTPETRTPLHTLARQLGNRCYNLLARSGFTTVEEVAATPDRCLLDFRGAGAKLVAAVRAATSGYTDTAAPVTHPGPSADVADRRARIDARLCPTQRARHREFTGMLAASSMPPAALATIADALAAEPVPAADPTVTLLLATADETGLLEYYTATHRDQTPAAPEV